MKLEKNIFSSKIDFISVAVMINYKEFLHASVADAVTKRKISFISGRLAARNALELSGVNSVGVGRDYEGRPSWPKKIVGSISHTNQVALAIVASSSEYRSIACDIESIIPRKKFLRIMDKILIKEELSVNLEMDDNLLGSVIFSAKESLYKLINPLVKTYIGFLEAKVLEVNNGKFSIELLKCSSREFEAIYHGVYRIENGMVETYLWLKLN